MKNDRKPTFARGWKAGLLYAARWVAPEKAEALTKLAHEADRDAASGAGDAAPPPGPPGGVADRTPGEIARAFHEAYEALAPHFGYRTREASAKPWAEVPETNRDLMVATVRAVLFEPIGVYPGPAPAAPTTTRDDIRCPKCGGDPTDCFQSPATCYVKANSRPATTTREATPRCPVPNCHAGMLRDHNGRDSVSCPVCDGVLTVEAHEPPAPAAPCACGHPADYHRDWTGECALGGCWRAAKDCGRCEEHCNAGAATCWGDHPRAPALDATTTPPEENVHATKALLGIAAGMAPVRNLPGLPPASWHAAWCRGEDITSDHEGGPAFCRNCGCAPQT